MKLLVLKCILFINIYMDLNFAQTLEWNSLIKSILEKQKHKAFERPSAPKDLIIFLVKKPYYLRSAKLKDQPLKINNEGLEPYKSLQMVAHQEMRSKSKSENKIKTESDETKESSEESFGGLKLTKEQSKMLRRRWNRSCDKKAAKICKKACKLTVKNVCRAYRCFKSQRSSFKRQCSRNCRLKFRG